MKLTKFIADLNMIAESTTQPEMIEVQMADGIPVVSPVFVGKNVYITDKTPSGDK
jgi:hypothetical protein